MCPKCGINSETGHVVTPEEEKQKENDVNKDRIKNERKVKVLKMEIKKPLNWTERHKLKS